MTGKIGGKDRHEKLRAQKGPPKSFELCTAHLSRVYECGEVVPLVAGGHGAPVDGFIPGEELLLLPWLPDVGGFEDPVFEDPVFGAEFEVPFVVEGKVPQGVPLGDEPGLFVVFGLTVDGCVELPCEGVLVEFEPGAVVLGVPLGEVGPGEV